VKRVLREISILSAANIRRWRPVARYSTHVLLWDESVRRALPVAGRPNFISSKMGCIVFLLFFRWHFMWPKMDSIDSMMTYQGYVFWSLCFWCLEFGDSGTQSDLHVERSCTGRKLFEVCRPLHLMPMIHDHTNGAADVSCLVEATMKKASPGLGVRAIEFQASGATSPPQVWHVFWAGHCVDFTRAWETFCGSEETWVGTCEKS
jgi:hypothetical protein